MLPIRFWFQKANYFLACVSLVGLLGSFGVSLGRGSLHFSVSFSLLHVQCTMVNRAGKKFAPTCDKIFQVCNVIGVLIQYIKFFWLGSYQQCRNKKTEKYGKLEKNTKSFHVHQDSNLHFPCRRLTYYPLLYLGLIIKFASKCVKSFRLLVV